MERRTARSPLGGAQPATWVLLAVALVVSGCSGESASAPHLDSELEGTMAVAPASATPGQEVALSFPSDNRRGIAFSLSRWNDGRWDETYYLTSDWGTPSDYTPGWWTVEGSENRGWQQVLISGPGPDHVLVPETASPGDYLLCTANASDEACALLTVTG